MIPTIFAGKYVKLLEISLETVISGYQYVNIAYFCLKLLMLES